MAEAAQLAGESMSIKNSLDERFDLAECLEVLAAIAADRRLGERAARLLGAAAALRGTIGARSFDDEPEAPPVHAAIRSLIGHDAMEAERAEGARWPLERAIAEATEIALVSPAGAISPNTSRTGAPPPPGGGTPAADRGGLTEREMEVLSYLARRFTDREIAAALTISPRTVTTHVARILTKLGVDGRRQAATEAARLGLLAS